MFHFQHGEPTSFAPIAGDVLIYTADNRNIHSVDEITSGERLTLTLWFTRDVSHDEDAKLISFLSQTPLNSSEIVFNQLLPSPASNNMYWFPPDQASTYQSGFDLRCARIYITAYDIYCSEEKNYLSAVDSPECVSESELLNEPLQLACRNHLFKKEFINILHALQVLQFYYWKCTELQSSRCKDNDDSFVQMSQSQMERIHELNLLFVKDYQSAETVFNHRSSRRSLLQESFDLGNLSAANVAWEAYTRKLHKEILICFPDWKSNNSIYSSPLIES